MRIGGATGTELTPAECPAFTDGTKEECNAASLMMHITPKASGYFENMWLWVADHMIEYAYRLTRPPGAYYPAEGGWIDLLTEYLVILIR